MESVIEDRKALNYLLLRDINVWMVKSQFEQPVPVASPGGFLETSQAPGSL